MNNGTLRGIGPTPVLPKWMGGGDPVNDGLPLTASSVQEGGATVGGVTGLLAARPVAGVAGRFYFATDVGPAPGTQYYDSGSVWTAVGGLTEVAYSEITSDFTHTGDTSYVDVTGLSIATFTIGDRPIYVDAWLGLENNTATDATLTQVQESVNGGAYSALCTLGIVCQTGETALVKAQFWRRRRSFSRGTTLAYKVQIKTTVSGATATMAGTTDQSNIAVLQV